MTRINEWKVARKFVDGNYAFKYTRGYSRNSRLAHRAIRENWRNPSVREQRGGNPAQAGIELSDELRETQAGSTPYELLEIQNDTWDFCEHHVIEYGKQEREPHGIPGGSKLFCDELALARSGFRVDTQDGICAALVHRGAPEPPHFAHSLYIDTLELHDGILGIPHKQRSVLGEPHFGKKKPGHVQACTLR